jgi:hypothetical protein
MAEYEVTISAIDFDFSTNRNEISAKEQSDFVSDVLERKWILAVEADEDLTGPLCQQVSNATGCLVRDVKFTAKSLG